MWMYRYVMVIIVGNGHDKTSSNPGDTICISHDANTLEKGINPVILPLTFGK